MNRITKMNLSLLFLFLCLGATATTYSGNKSNKSSTRAKWGRMAFFFKITDNMWDYLAKKGFLEIGPNNPIYKNVAINVRMIKVLTFNKKNSANNDDALNKIFKQDCRYSSEITENEITEKSKHQ